MADNVVKTRIYEEGNYGFKVAPINSDKSYGDAEAIEGVMTIDCTMSRTVSNIPADDVIDYISRTSPEKGEGTITFTGLKKADYIKLYNAITDGSGVLTFGRKTSPKKVGITFFNTQNYEGGSSINKFTLNNVTFTLPNITTQSIAEDDNTIRPFSLSFTANAYNYTDKDGKADRVTWSIVNSEDNADIWKAVKDGIYVPDSQVISL